MFYLAVTICSYNVSNFFTLVELICIRVATTYYVFTIIVFFITAIRNWIMFCNLKYRSLDAQESHFSGLLFANYIDKARRLVIYTLNKVCINNIFLNFSWSFDLIMGSSPSKGSGNRQTGPPGRERSTIKSAFNYHRITNNVSTCISCRCTAEHLFQYR